MHDQKSLNPHKGMVMKSIWFNSNNEYQRLKDAIEGNNQEEAFRIISKINIRGDL